MSKFDPTLSILSGRSCMREVIDMDALQNDAQKVPDHVTYCAAVPNCIPHEI